MFRYILVLLILMISSVSYSQTEILVGKKEQANAELEKIFNDRDELQTQTSYGNDIRLQRRTIKATSGIEKALLEQQKSSPEQAQLVIARIAYFPTQKQWNDWGSQGINYVEYLSNNTWLLEVNSELNNAFFSTKAESFNAFTSNDKISPVLDKISAADEFFDDKNGLVVLSVGFSAGKGKAQQLIRSKYHLDGHKFIDNSGQRYLTMVTKIEDIANIAEYPEVTFVGPGQWTAKELMSGVRLTVNANKVIGHQSNVLQGTGVKMANREGLGGGIHEDFINHDSMGNPTSGRWTFLAGNSCLGSSNPNSSAHGQMTAGIMLGNGWGSSAAGGANFEFRGIARDATYECYFNSQARANVSSHSVVQTGNPVNGYSNSIDAAVLGLSGANKYHAQMAAAGNNGHNPQYYTEAGYFSILNGFKNQMSVGNAQLNDQIMPSSSIGPTFDGRIKPDISAATGTYVHNKEFSLEVEHISLKRNGATIYHWTFDGPINFWHRGWGQTANQAFGQLFLSINQTTNNMEVNVDAPPWGTQWHHSPVLGTQVIPYDHPGNGGDPLNFQGHEDDVLEIKFRSSGGNIGYFDVIPSWFRSFPPTNTSDWYSQGLVSSFANGSGQWNTVQYKVGQARNHINPNPYWPQEFSWKEQPIQWLGLRFKSTHKQLTTRIPQTYQGASGTSAASPAVAGGYAIAMEHLTKIYPLTELDDHQQLSIYNAISKRSYGAPDNSTWKAIFIQTARDMIKNNDPDVPDNLDTGQPTNYFFGPDYATGYGMMNVQSAIDLMTKELTDPAYVIKEHSLNSGEYHVYKIKVSDEVLQADKGLRVTLAWDDALASNTTDLTASKLVNNLGIFLKDPQGNIHYPWSIDLPYDIYQPGQGPHQVEPEPITHSDIVPARRDQPNSRDNVEQIQVDYLLGEEMVGYWYLYVVDDGIATPDAQKYSVVASPWQFKKNCHLCE